MSTTQSESPYRMKMHRIAFEPCDLPCEQLKPLFEQRRQVAKKLLESNTYSVHRELTEVYEYLNKQIKLILNL